MTTVLFLLVYDWLTEHVERFESDEQAAKDQAETMRALPEYKNVRLYRCEEV